MRGVRFHGMLLQTLPHLRPIRRERQHLICRSRGDAMLCRISAAEEGRFGISIRPFLANRLSSAVFDLDALPILQLALFVLDTAALDAPFGQMAREPFFASYCTAAFHHSPIRLG